MSGHISSHMCTAFCLRNNVTVIVCLVDYHVKTTNDKRLISGNPALRIWYVFSSNHGSHVTWYTKHYRNQIPVVVVGGKSTRSHKLFHIWKVRGVA